jgi:DNA primase small subunit
LKTEFGFNNYKFFFSGGRGLHCWVFDECAMNFDNFTRKAICAYFGTVLSKQKFCDEYTEIMKNFVDGTEKMIYEKMFLRLDSNVTGDVKHLLKSPFCVHPTSNLICVCLSVDNIYEINLEDIPDLDTVLEKPEVLLKFIHYL